MEQKLEVAQNKKSESGKQSLVRSDDYPMVSFSDDAPPLHVWMLKSDKQHADWLGIKYNNKTLHEPINILISDPFASSIEETESKLIEACTRADYLDRYGHTSDYIAIVNGTEVPLFPSLKKHAFSNRIFAETNNHGRIFGPVFFKGKYWFCAAFSREKFHIEPFEHIYISFNQARDNFAWSLNDEDFYKVKSFVSLGNVILGSDSESSGDHDGIAILLEAVK